MTQLNDMTLREFAEFAIDSGFDLEFRLRKPATSSDGRSEGRANQRTTDECAQGFESSASAECPTGESAVSLQCPTAGIKAGPSETAAMTECLQDAILYGVGIMQDGERVAPHEFFVKPESQAILSSDKIGQLREAIAAVPAMKPKRGRGRPKSESKRPWEADGVSRAALYRRRVGK